MNIREEKEREREISLHVDPQGVEGKLTMVLQDLFLPPLLRRWVEVIRKGHFAVRPDISQDVSTVRFIGLRVASLGPANPHLFVFALLEHLVVLLFGVDRRIENSDELHSVFV